MILLSLLLPLISIVSASLLDEDIVANLSETFEVLRLESKSRPICPFTELYRYVLDADIEEVFVSKSVIINGVDFGPRYFSLNPKIDRHVVKIIRGYSFIDNLNITLLEFSNEPDFEGVDPNDHQAVWKMKEKLLKRSIFKTSGLIFVRRVIVNGMDYGRYLIPFKIPLAPHNS
jgi:hypothetical protein